MANGGRSHPLTAHNEKHTGGAYCWLDIGGLLGIGLRLRGEEAANVERSDQALIA